jgi:hypothetical protein
MGLDAWASLTCVWRVLLSTVSFVSPLAIDEQRAQLWLLGLLLVLLIIRQCSFDGAVVVVSVIWWVSVSYLHSCDVVVLEAYTFIALLVSCIIGGYVVFALYRDHQFLQSRLNFKNVSPGIREDFVHPLRKYFLSIDRGRKIYRANYKRNTGRYFALSLHIYCILMLFSGFVITSHVNVKTYNWIMGPNGKHVPDNFLESKPKIMFIGPASSGKTTLIYALFNHGYFKYDIRPEPSTDSFVCIVSNCTGKGDLTDFQPDLSQCSVFREAQSSFESDPLCEMAADASHTLARHVADDNTLFGNVVIIDSPGYLLSYFEKATCHHRSAFERISSLVDHIFLVWAMPLQLHRGFLPIFKERQLEESYHIIFNMKGGDESEAFLLDQHKQFVNPLAGSESWKHGNGLINVPKSYDWDFFISYTAVFDAITRKMTTAGHSSHLLQKSVQQLIHEVTDSQKYRFISDAFRETIDRLQLREKLSKAFELLSTRLWDQQLQPASVLPKLIEGCRLPLPQDRDFEASITLIREKILLVTNRRRKAMLRSALQRIIRSSEKKNGDFMISGSDSLQRLRAARQLVSKLDVYAEVVTRE